MLHTRSGGAPTSLPRGSTTDTVEGAQSACQLPCHVVETGGPCVVAYTPVPAHPSTHQVEPHQHQRVPPTRALTKNQTRQWAAWTHQEEEIFFNALRQVGKNFDKITHRVQSKNKDQVSHYYYRLVRRMKKLLGPRFSLDAKNSKDTIAAMLRCDAMRLFLEDANSPQASHENEIFAKYVEDSVRKAFLHGNLALADVSVINHSSSTTILSFFWYHNTDSIDLWEVRQLLVANAEDYRTVLCRKGIAVDMSKDHRPTYDAEHQRVIECGGYIEDGYLNGVLSMTRALGD
uniref:protein-serine/threonine phosphatase n=1 Tax=Zea mays TaxID=4577 RepID=A0A804M4R9_MAIZE